MLDPKRRFNQMNEALAILRTLRTGKGWPNHPATKQWIGYDRALEWYLFRCAQINMWSPDLSDKQRNAASEVFKTMAHIQDEEVIPSPWWLGSEPFHALHRGALKAKDPEYYPADWIPSVRNARGQLPYMWGVDNKWHRTGF